MLEIGWTGRHVRVSLIIRGYGPAVYIWKRGKRPRMSAGRGEGLAWLDLGRIELFWHWGRAGAWSR